jgi:hypothetical protein
MSNLGYLMLGRGFFSHWLWLESRSFSKADAFLDLLQIAAFTPTSRMIQGKLIRLDEGELVASLRYLAARWTWSKDKVSAFLILLETEDMISRESRQGETVIILCNYKDYNGKRDSNQDSKKTQSKTAARQRQDNDPDKEEELKERELLIRGEPVTLAKAISYGQQIGVAKEMVEHWHAVRTRDGWAISGSNMIQRPITAQNWMHDLATVRTWRNSSTSGNYNGKSRQTRGSEPPDMGKRKFDITKIENAYDTNETKPSQES